jgi:hypothetical protein
MKRDGFCLYGVDVAMLNGAGSITLLLEESIAGKKGELPRRCP